jgi:hypothetical protein
MRTVSLPGGLIAVAPLETSGEGQLFVRHDACAANRVINLRARFHHGLLSDVTADSGAKCLKDVLSLTDSSGRTLGQLHIGLNAAFERYDAASDFRVGDSAGNVSVSVGFNRDLGGVNSAGFAWEFPIAHATVVADGVTIVRDGHLVEPR